MHGFYGSKASPCHQTAAEVAAKRRAAELQRRERRLSTLDATTLGMALYYSAVALEPPLALAYSAEAVLAAEAKGSASDQEMSRQAPEPESTHGGPLRWKPTGLQKPTGIVDPTKEPEYAVKPEIAGEREAAFAAKRASVLGQVRSRLPGQGRGAAGHGRAGHAQG